MAAINRRPKCREQRTFMARLGPAHMATPSALYRRCSSATREHRGAH
jgi:hypothetical protein